LGESEKNGATDGDIDIVEGKEVVLTRGRICGIARPLPDFIFISATHQCMSQQSAAAKPSLQGVRIKARKGAVKAQAKHEPTGQCPIQPPHPSLSPFSPVKTSL